MREILANCIREDVNGYVIEALVSEFPTMQDLMNASGDELKSIKGIGVVKAKQLKAILEFVRKAHAPDINKVIIRSPKDVYDLVRGDMEFLQVEHFDVIGLSTKSHVVFRENISIGTLNSSLAHPREIYKGLIKRSCCSCILVHNHPSGDPLPSQEDIALTKQLVKAGEILQIAVLDHVIVGGNGAYTSLKEMGYC